MKHKTINQISLNSQGFLLKYQKAPVVEHPNKVIESIKLPLVSVRISTYQHSEFIRLCIEGVLNQNTKFPFEVLIGEDESTDGTRDICKEYADKYPDRIRLFLHCRDNNIHINGHPTGRFQYIWTHFQARGKYIAECEGDDIWQDSGKIQTQFDFLENHSEYVLCSHSFNKFDFETKNDLGLFETPDFLSTRMYRNIINNFPIPFFYSECADTFTTHMLKREGKSKFLKEIKPTIKFLHKGGIISKKHKRIAYEKSLNTKHMLLQTYPDNKRFIKKSILRMIIRYQDEKKAFSNNEMKTCFFREILKEKLVIYYFILIVKSYIIRILTNIRNN